MNEFWRLVEESKKLKHTPHPNHPNTTTLCRGIEKALNDIEILKAGEIIYSKPVGKQMIKVFFTMYKKGCQ
tara:strand:- start:438 stop:650 length:213 start_codon:yes stop_codon:yes gene_type:complete